MIKREENELIARYMGYKKGDEFRTDGNFSDAWFAPDGNSYHALFFTSDWGWLMPVVKKLNDKESQFTLIDYDLRLTVQKVVSVIREIQNWDKSEVTKGIWYEVGENNCNLPRIRDEFLVKNANQGDTKELLYFDKTRGYFCRKGEPALVIQATHYMIIP